MCPRAWRRTNCKMELLSIIFIVVGLVFFFGAVVGLVRFPDFYTRMHAAGKAAPAFGGFSEQKAAVKRDFRFCAGSTAAGGAAASVAPSSAVTASGPDVTYMCEFRVDGKLQVVPVKARNLSWLPGKPSNFPLPDQTCDDAIAGQNSNAGQGGTESPWQVGALVRLLDTSSSGSSALAPGRGARSIGCISSVHLEDSKVSVCAFAGADSCLSDCGDVKIGAEVCLAFGYAQVQDASKGPLVAGQKGSVKALQDGLVLVESIGQDNVKALWWYEPEALVLASTSGPVQTERARGSKVALRGGFFWLWCAVLEFGGRLEDSRRAEPALPEAAARVHLQTLKMAV